MLRVNNEQLANDNKSERNNAGHRGASPVTESRRTHQTGLPETSHRCRIKEGTMWVDEVNFVVFICKVVYIGLEQPDMKELKQ